MQGVDLLHPPTFGTNAAEKSRMPPLTMARANCTQNAALLSMRVYPAVTHAYAHAPLMVEFAAAV